LFTLGYGRQEAAPPGELLVCPGPATNQNGAGYVMGGLCQQCEATLSRDLS
ncbi:unnamed protein product, partial [Ectocarpus sp. 12 AP-2014]